MMQNKCKFGLIKYTQPGKTNANNYLTTTCIKTIIIKQ